MEGRHIYELDVVMGRKAITGFGNIWEDRDVSMATNDGMVEMLMFPAYLETRIRERTLVLTEIQSVPDENYLNPLLAGVID